MDVATLIGIVLGFGLILGSILIGGGLGAFIDIPSALIVIGISVGGARFYSRRAVWE